jgi:hypothetical protein
MPEPLQVIYENLSLLENIDHSDPTTSASYRHLAQNVVADPSIALNWREMIADKLNQANALLAQTTSDKQDSY